jgi:hypothetical protein
MIRAVKPLWVGTVALVVLQAIPADAAEICDRTMASPGQLLDTLRNEPGIQLIHEDDLYMAFAEKSHSIVWTFTRPGHPAHPAVVCRRPVEQGAAVAIEMRVVCGGPKDACDRLVADFEELNKRMREDFERNHPSQ